MQNRKHKTDLIIVDYLQIVNCDSNDNRAVAIGRVSTALKELAKDLNVPVIALSQLNRNSESREDGMPQMSDLKESGQIEQDADVVLLIHRDRETPNTAKLIIAKNRNGPTGEIDVNFHPAQCMFEDFNYLD